MATASSERVPYLQTWQMFNGIVSGDSYTKWQSQDGSYVSNNAVILTDFGDG